MTNEEGLIEIISMHPTYEEGTIMIDSSFKQWCDNTDFEDEDMEIYGTAEEAKMAAIESILQDIKALLMESAGL